jgi:2-oxoglutarate ferredoxin oxidoreductase subunit alpha
MAESTVLIGGKAGDGINRAGSIIGRLYAACGYRIYMNYDYPSLIRGGHNFAILRASEREVATHHDRVDYLLALDKNTLEIHKERTGPKTSIIYNSDMVKEEWPGIAVPISTITKEAGGLPIMENSCVIGAFSKVAGFAWETVERVLKQEIPRETGKNLTIARGGYDAVDAGGTITPLPMETQPLVSGNEAIALGLLAAGLDAYIAYPMTPSSGILHFLAAEAGRFGINVVHPENEIAVILMALGSAYAGARSAVGTSGGGFALMNEGFSMAGMTEIPLTVVVSQRGGPSTGTPTYTAQGDLLFVLRAGHGEFPRFIIAPGTPAQAVEWSARALNLSWKYQVPAVILVDKTLSEGTYTFDPALIDSIERIPPLWGKEGEYRRYADTLSGVSPLAVPPLKGSVIKVNSYAHDQDGYTTEQAGTVAWLHEKQMRKGRFMKEEIESLSPVERSGVEGSSTALVSWGSNAGVAREVAENLGISAVQPVVLEPFPVDAMQSALGTVEMLIAVEDNITGQLSGLMQGYGFKVDEEILRYDSRPFSVDELTRRVKEMMK